MIYVYVYHPVTWVLYGRRSWNFDHAWCRPCLGILRSPSRRRPQCKCMFDIRWFVFLSRPYAGINVTPICLLPRSHPFRGRPTSSGQVLSTSTFTVGDFYHLCVWVVDSSPTRGQNRLIGENRRGISFARLNGECSGVSGEAPLVVYMGKMELLRPESISGRSFKRKTVLTG